MSRWLSLTLIFSIILGWAVVSLSVRAQEPTYGGTLRVAFPPLKPKLY